MEKEHIYFTTTDLFKNACDSLGKLSRGEITTKEAHLIATELGKENKRLNAELMALKLMKKAEAKINSSNQCTII